MSSTGLLAVLIFVIPMCFTPGPNNLLCAAHGSQHGFRNTIPLTLGMAIGWSTLGIFVAIAADYIEKNEEIFRILTYFVHIFHIWRIKLLLLEQLNMNKILNCWE